MPNSKEKARFDGGRAGRNHVYSQQHDHTEDREYHQEQNINRDRPLSLRHDFRPHKSDLCDAVGRKLSDTEFAIMFDLARSEEIHSYSRNPYHYNVPGRYRTNLYSFKKVTGGMDRLAADGLVFNWKQESGVRGLQSTCAATPALVEIIRNVTDGQPPKLILPHEPVILRDAEKNLIDYKDNAKTKAMRRSLYSYNEALNSTDITGVDKGCLKRIFNGDFASGGRAYADGGSWQALSAKSAYKDGKPVPEHMRRKCIKINDEEVAELDYKNLHPRLLYARLSIEAPFDCYDVKYYHRDLAKVALLILLNASSRHGAVNALAHKDEMQKTGTALKGSPAAFEIAKGLLDSLCHLHKPISQFFFTGVGSSLMAIDADIAQTVMDKMLRQDMVVLPVHDSFIAQRSHAPYLREIMTEAAFQKCGVTIPIEQKY